MRMPNVGETSEVTSPNPGVLYYGVYVPNDTNLGEDNDKVHVYTDKSEALKLVKKYKKARFKAFRLKEEAEEFAEHGSESCGTTASTPERSGPVAEKPSPFKAPKPQDLVQLRKAIETGATDIVKKIVLENPRYLISIGDTPAILQEGSRYNALHIAAKARRDDICEFILDTVGDPAFISRLYGDDDMISCQSRANILLDLYLNMPDKGLNETPLHFASKFGATAVVAKLVSYSECDKHPKNKFSQTPKDMICSRAPSSNATDVKTIRNLLEEQFYVPVLRSEDNSLPPTVGEPFSPSRPPALVQHVVNPTVDIHAYAGPMPQEEAKIFRKKWKTPPRSVSSSAGTPTKNDSPLALSTTVRLMDTEKGLERIGRTLAHETKVGWKEYWPFLGTFTDFATKEGLDLLEAYMKKRFQETWGKHVSNDASLNTKDRFNMMQLTNTACDRIEQTPSEGSAHGKNCVVSPITDLCVAFKACSLEENYKAYTDNEYHSPVKQIVTKNASFDDDNKGKAKLTSCEHETLTDILENPDICPLLYVEKSCQVFAKRIADGLSHRISIVHRVQSDDIIFETLWPEVKHIQRVVSSFMDDHRFVSVDFHRIHSRISVLACSKLNTLAQEDLEFILNCLQSETKVVKIADTVSSDEEDSGTVRDTVQYRSQKIIPSNDKTESLIEQQVKCFARNILSALMKHGEVCTSINNLSSPIATTEEECKSMWSNASPCSCKLQNHLFTRRSRVGSSFKRTCKNSGVTFKTMPEISRRPNLCQQGDDNFEKHCEHKELAGGGSGDVDNDGNPTDDDKFFTPPGSPHDSIEEFADVSDGENVFIEGNTPGKVDLDVLHALAGVDILQQKYPNIYRWRHAILLYPEKERELWASPAFTRHLKKLQTPGTLTPTHRHEDGFLSSPDAWHRRLVRCTHAPRAVDFSNVT
ncbi:ankyrin repeat and LEM domain-containing protein 2 homolog isoform X1 [Schistocerca americana]|uniref:ankyrin repeat and LEM domain-containing protein 2 homolog isoform X1 n=1 Tax=Schistocerca americana TaxID=7009 RepID=UPI001F4F923A|nr:ankyrin repeat and LEM domain-containing protein 2 homolog isoform X1 [Schistocerca americana]